MLNKVILMGRLCADPDFRQTQSGIAVCRIRVAIDRPYTSKSTGERQADFINVVCWRQQAEFVSRYFHKGSMIIVEGRLQNSDYTDGNGVKHYSMEVQADNVTFGEPEPLHRQMETILHHPIRAAISISRSTSSSHLHRRQLHSSQQQLRLRSSRTILFQSNWAT